MASKLLYLEGVRGIAAFIVLQLHSLRLYNKPLKNFFMLYQEWSFAVPIFFILSGRVLTLSALKKNNPNGIFSSVIKRPFRLTMPLIGVMIVALIMYQLGTFVILDKCPEAPGFCAASDKVAQSFYELIMKPFLYICNSSLFQSNANELPLPITAWTLPLEYANSNYVYLLSLVLIHLSGNYHARWLVLIGALVMTIYTHLWTSHFVVGVIFAEMANTGTFDKIKASKITPIFNILLLALGVFLAIDSPYSIGGKSHDWIKQYQVDHRLKFGDWETYDDASERPFVLLLSTVIMFIIETTDFLQWMFGSAPCVFLGRISYMCYLFHPFFNYSVQPRIVDALDPKTVSGQILIPLICTTLVLLISEVLVRLFDEPTLVVIRHMYKAIFVKDWTSKKSDGLGSLPKPNMEGPSVSAIEAKRSMSNIHSVVGSSTTQMNQTQSSSVVIDQMPRGRSLDRRTNEANDRQIHY
ncbi:hypothetical protein HDV02_004656 [Globomyces sp. JEL0801]|nr:hypothetical protein HDV02_004656 [Globomyces sp. JEL0801]